MRGQTITIALIVGMEWRKMIKWISKILGAILGFIAGIFMAPIVCVFFTLCLLIMWLGVGLMCLSLPFYMAYEGMDLE